MAKLSQRYCYAPDAGLRLLKPEINDESLLSEKRVDGLSRIVKAA